MNQDAHDLFKILREDVHAIRRDVLGELATIRREMNDRRRELEERCSRRGEEIAILMNRERERQRAIDRRIAGGLALITLVSVLLKFLL